MDDKDYLSLELEHVGVLAGLLKNMTGNATLIHELIQNADDAKAEVMWFRLSDTAMVVDNNKSFTDCGHDRGPCPWDPICDFHGFRKPASQRKRGDAEGIGAFGIGFTAVLGVTDHPELISNKRHWTRFDEREEGGKRIEQCRGCERCSGDVPPTRFILPWAFEDSILRHGLKIDPISRERPRELLDDLVRLLPETLLFLNHVRKAYVFWDDDERLEVVHDDKNHTITVNGTTQQWHVIQADFANDASKLKEWYPHIDRKQRSRVTIAIPRTLHDSGVFCAFLPTELKTDLPFHFNADFFPTNDRKGLLFTGDYHGKWNDAALRNGKQCLVYSLPGIRDFLSPQDFWQFIDRISDISGHSQHFGDLWGRAKDVISNGRYFFSKENMWELKQTVVYDGESSEVDFSELYRQLGIKILHPSIATSKQVRSFLSQLRASHIRLGLESVGIVGDVPRSDLPQWFQTQDNWHALLERVRRILTVDGSARDELRSASLATCVDGVVRPCHMVYVADRETIKLFGRLAVPPYFLIDEHLDRRVVAGLCHDFTPEVAVEFACRSVESDRDNVESLAEELRAWFGNKLDALSDTAKKRLAGLPICPTNRGLRPFAETIVADQETIELFCPLGRSSQCWVEDRHARPFTKLCGRLTFETAIEIVKGTHQEVDNRTASMLLTFFARSSRGTSDNDKQQLRRLPICPTAGGPGSPDSGVTVRRHDFSDPIGVASIADLSDVSPQHITEVEYFLTSVLRVPQLTFEEYVKTQLPSYFATHTPDLVKCKALVEFLARHKLGQILESTELKKVLRQLPLIETDDGTIKSANDGVYIDNATVREVLGDEASLVTLAPDTPALNEFYTKGLEIPESPKLEQVVGRVKRIASNDMSTESIRKIKTLCGHLAKRVDEIRDTPENLRILTDTKWLPGTTFRGAKEVLVNEWLKPSELILRSRVELCSSVGRFTAFNVVASFARLIGVRIEPSMNEVVDHVIHLIDMNHDIPHSVYKWLNDRIDEIPDRLRDLPCICVTAEEKPRFVKGSECTFVRDHPFGPYRLSLDDSWRQIDRLLSKLGVKSEYSWIDAVDVLQHAANHREFQEAGVLSAECRSALFHCWKLLNEQVELNNQEAVDRIKSCLTGRVIPTSHGRLISPAYAYFSDSVSDVFTSQLETRLIEPIAEVWHAMKEAGVRTVGELTMIMVESVAPREDEHVTAHLQERMSLIREALHAFRGIGHRIAELSMLQFIEADACEVTYVFRDHRAPAITSDATTRVAVLEIDRMQLTYTRDGSEIPWDIISAELASFIVAPKRDDAVKISPHIYACLEPETMAKAQRKLASLGMMKMERMPDAPKGAVSKPVVTNNGDDGVDRGSGAGSNLDERDGSSIPSNAAEGESDKTRGAAGQDKTGDFNDDLPTSREGNKGHSQKQHENSLSDKTYEKEADPAQEPSSASSGRTDEMGQSDLQTVPPGHSEDGPSAGAGNPHGISRESNRGRPGGTDSPQMPDSPLEGEFFDKRQEQPGGSSRRTEKKRAQARKARPRAKTTSMRSHRQQKLTKAEVAPYLIGHYKDENGNLRCQICERGMPFKGRDKEDYWERRELLTGQWATSIGIIFPEDELPEDESLYLLLCPECNSFYREYVFLVADAQNELLCWLLEGDELDFLIPCHYPDKQIRFIPKHLSDIRAVLSERFVVVDD